MRIGIDMFGVQSPSRHRGIGRYTRHLVHTLLTRHTEHEYVLYFYDGLDGAGDGWPGRSTIRRLGRDCPRGTLRHSPQQLTKVDDRLDALLLTCAVESFESYLPPDPLPEGPPTAAILYDLIPAMMPDEYLNQPGLADAYHAALRRLRQYDRLLAISEATRRDGLRQLGLAADRIVTIGTAVDSEFFVPDRGQPASDDVRRLLTGLGIERPFVFCLSGTDERKNLRGLLAAYDCLPERLRQSHQLVITCRMHEAEAAHWRAEARRRGGDGRVLFTDFLPDDIVRTLYQRCAAFVFPSLYEGFGLPLLEAMHCGAAVLAGNNSSQPDVVGDAGLLADAGNPAALAAGLAQLLDDPALARVMGQRALVQARKFSWEATARRTAAALESLAPSTSCGVHGGADRGLKTRKPRIAYFSPLPPKRSGISDYSHRLLAALKEHYTIDLFHDVGYTPHLAHASHEFACHDYRLFPRCKRALNYSGIVYQMGNSEHHAFVYETLLAHPGVVVLHDFVLSDFHYWYSLQPGAPAGFLEREIACDAPQLTADDRSPARWIDEPGGVVAACNRRGIAFNRRILEHAAQIVVHDPWGAQRIGSLDPEFASRLHVVPHGASVYPYTDEQRQAVRRRYGFAASDLLLGCFGILHESKYPVETIEAFAALTGDFAAARLMFVGRDLGGGAAQAKAAELGVADRVRFFGHASMDAFLELVAITDIGVNLRRPPTHGETSGALLTLLGSGVATVVTDVDAFGGYPDSVVCKIPPVEAADRSLEQAVRRLAQQPETRRQIGLAAIRHIGENHSWPRIATLYAEVIEQTHSTANAA
ncbi:MAG TPA: glycosyltransferase [Pirellulales bacterium]